MRARVLVTTSWEIETEDFDEALVVASKQVGSMMAKVQSDAFGHPIRTHHRVDRLRDKPRKQRLAEFLPEEVIPYISRDDIRKSYVVGDKTYLVRMNSQRYFVFRESLACVVCGLVGSKMVLEQHPSDKNPHFNLYAEEDDKLILMTKDHIQAKSFGGEDRHSNYQTMCIVCNNLKGSANITLEGIKELRQLYNANKDVLGKKELHVMLSMAKAKLAVPHIDRRVSNKQRHFHAADCKSKEQFVIASCDINVWKMSEGLVGRSVYDQAASGDHIACIKRGTVLEPVGKAGRKVEIKIQDGTSVLISQGLLDYQENQHDPHQRTDCDAGRHSSECADGVYDPVREGRECLDEGSTCGICEGA